MGWLGKKGASENKLRSIVCNTFVKPVVAHIWNTVSSLGDPFSETKAGQVAEKRTNQVLECVNSDF